MSTQDCLEEIQQWFEEQGVVYPGMFKRLKKFKNTEGLVERHFKSEKHPYVLQVIERPAHIDIFEITEKVGDGYYFIIDKNFGYGDADVYFCVVRKNYFDTYHCINSVHFNDYRKMPIQFEEEMESCFAVYETIEQKVREELIALGFNETTM